MEQQDGSALLQLPDDALYRVASFLDGQTAARGIAVCTAFRALLSRDSLWRALCEAKGWKQTSVTRTRGHRPWREVFAGNVCSECHSTGDLRGTVVFDLDGGGTLARACRNTGKLPLCIDCVETVQRCVSYADRLASLPRLRVRLEDSWQYRGLLYKIPQAPAGARSRQAGRPCRPGAEGADYNDHLLNGVVSKQKRPRRK